MTNALDLGKEALARFRKLHPTESLDQQCQRMSGYYTQWAYQDNEIGIKVYASANAAWIAAPRDGSLVNEMPVGGFGYWNVGTYGHVAMCIGYDGKRALILHTSQKGDTVLTLDPFWRVSHADTYPFPFRNWSFTNGANPRMTVTGWSPAPVPGPAQRLVVPAGANARTAPSTTATKVKVLAPNSIVDMVGFTNAGETVSGNSRWFKTAEGPWAWSGGFTNTSGAGLPDLTPPPPVVKHPVTFTDGSTTGTVQVEHGKPVAEPPAPTKPGFAFDGWLSAGKPYDFALPVTGPLTLTASWEAVVVPEPEPDPSVPPAWFVDFVRVLIDALTKYIAPR